MFEANATNITICVILVLTIGVVTYARFKNWSFTRKPREGGSHAPAEGAATGSTDRPPRTVVYETVDSHTLSKDGPPPVEEDLEAGKESGYVYRQGMSASFAETAVPERANSFTDLHRTCAMVCVEHKSQSIHMHGRERGAMHKPVHDDSSSRGPDSPGSSIDLGFQSLDGLEKKKNQRHMYEVKTFGKTYKHDEVGELQKSHMEEGGGGADTPIPWDSYDELAEPIEEVDVFPFVEVYHPPEVEKERGVSGDSRGDGI
uniref:Uncharacterized protein n=1 Tax=Chromera velia CCMP2878 TaxID=1169474 RepID=A0A0G4FLH8_9ALVE|eukprot:Cvel_3499.t1-p1 / transcript=Cvel_3499.t1 / gene=Cvel_3499 / organism=Chromera_velia_CCMP2878 / gene_product=hypothetical protein / transcript_product=hypothetical protein / location=Cvel_scaffold141:102904-103677(+) / protein_length=258 / sequence_SO=supercontig / SO=protein_coding / is_pseudo=false